MKKILIGILLVMLLALGYITIISGFSAIGFEVLGYKNMSKLNQDLAQKIEEASTITSVTFPQKLSSLNSASKKLISTKERYQDKVAYSSEENVRRAIEKEVYQVDFLFTRIGNHAKRFGLEVDLDAKFSKTLEDKDTSGQSKKYDYYDLYMTLHGKYALIADFVRAIENDSELGFTIRNFVLTPEFTEKTDTLKAEFVIKDLILDVDESITTSSITTSMADEDDTLQNTDDDTDASAGTNTNRGRTQTSAESSDSED